MYPFFVWNKVYVKSDGYGAGFAELFYNFALTNADMMYEAKPKNRDMIHGMPGCNLKLEK